MQEDELVSLVLQEHNRDHRGPESVYESLCSDFYPVVREVVERVFQCFAKTSSVSFAPSKRLCRKQPPEENDQGDIPQLEVADRPEKLVVRIRMQHH